jgi:integrase
MPLSDSKLRGLRATGARFELPDRDGLVLRVGANGSMTWTLTYTVRGAGETPGVRVVRRASDRRRMTLGTYPAMSLSDARDKAQAVNAAARAGTDPQPRTAVAATPSDGPMQVVTVGDLLTRYTREHLDRNLGSGSNVERLLRRHVESSWGDRAVAVLRAPDLVALLEHVRQPAGALVCASGHEQHYAAVRGGPGAAVEVRKWVRAMFQFGVAIGALPANPFREVRNRDRVRPRDRVLSMEEIAAVWRAAGRMYYPWSPLFRLLLLTGARRSEWADAKRPWTDSGFTRLEIPASDYKTEKTHVVPFSTQVRALVRGLPNLGFGPYLLTSDGGKTPVSGFSKAKLQLDELVTAELGSAKPLPWVLHDLRRSMATHMERLGLTPHLVEACLGHALKGVAGAYRHYGFLEEKRTALQQWADEVEAHAHPIAVAAE